MSVYLNKAAADRANSIVNAEGFCEKNTTIKSFKKNRIARRKGRRKRQAEKLLSLPAAGGNGDVPQTSYVGPTPETKRKLRPDPLMLFGKKNILNSEQIWAFQRIRRAIKIITDGTGVRTSHFTGAPVQTSRFMAESESEYEIKIKDHYCDWMDRMTAERLQAGSILDIIIDEMSLSAVDRKWGKRKGWAKEHLQASLTLYSGFSHLINRIK
ncbi:hypothetical protein MNBD_ALPHA03-1859 [hydrothermal vent metagenome]|uniref:Uncharacterized protein n=1 Tax=hydrothermal vent metagenome TaxID=652676 RepID=A0A3B1AN03_9ZZZZ